MSFMLLQTIDKMKKTLFLFLFIITAINIFSQLDEKKISSLHYYSKMSITIGGGYDYYRVNPFAQNPEDGFWGYYILGEGDFTFPQISIKYGINRFFWNGYSIWAFWI